MKSAQGYAAKVGVLGGEAKDGDEEGLTVAQVAFWNEYGTRRADGSEHVPERPAFRAGAEGAKPGLRILSKAETGAILDGTHTPAQAMGRLGAYLQGQIQASIVALRDPPNAESTVDRKGSSNPLIDSGQLRQSIVFEVVRNAKADAPGRIGGA